MAPTRLVYAANNPRLRGHNRARKRSPDGITDSGRLRKITYLRSNEVMLLVGSSHDPQVKAGPHKLAANFAESPCLIRVRE